MLEAFQSHIEKQQLITPNDKLLLACSGGRDSMALAHLLLESGYTFALAHFNFCLRDEESDRDETFVKTFASQHNCVCYVKKQDALQYAQTKGISVEMAARDLRYNWFEELVKQNNFTKVLVAHHADDSIETFFINLLRGTGIDGLKGIATTNKYVVRPLLWATRAMIDQYVTEKNIAFCDDSTNAEDVYLRNQIRHQIIPALEKIDLQFKQTMQTNMLRMSETAEFVNTTIEQIKTELIVKENNTLKINIAKLKQHPMLVWVRILKEYNFSPPVIIQLFKSIQAESGKQFFSETHRLVKDREYLIIEKLEVRNQELEVIINVKDTEISQPIKLSFSIEHIIEISKEKNSSTLDLDTLQFPLTLRKWKEGDAFQPFGMKGKKLLSDYFIDEKFTVFEKENVWLLCSNNEIAWVIGHRIDDRFKVTGKTKKIYKIVHGT